MFRSSQISTNFRASSHSQRGKISYGDQDISNLLNKFPSNKVHQINRTLQSDRKNENLKKSATIYQHPLNYISNFQQYKSTPKQPSQIQSLTKKINILSDRLTKNQQQIEYLKYPQKYSRKKSSKQQQNTFKENKLISSNQSINKQFLLELQECKKQIQSIKYQLPQYLQKIQFDSKIQSIQWKMKQYNPPNANTIYKKTFQALQLQMEKSIIQVKQFFNQSNLSIRSTKFSNTTIDFKFQERISFHNKSNGQKIDNIISSKTYYIDDEGYLLDSDRCYLINKNNRMIRLKADDITLLKKINVIP